MTNVRILRALWLSAPIVAPDSPSPCVTCGQPYPDIERLPDHRILAPGEEFAVPDDLAAQMIASGEAEEIES